MNIERLLNLDIRKEKQLSELIETVNKIVKSSNGKPTIEEIESKIDAICRKYKIKIQYINVSHIDGSIIYDASIKTTDEHKWLGNVYGITIYEVFCKILLKMFYHVKNNDVKKCLC